VIKKAGVLAWISLRQGYGKLIKYKDEDYAASRKVEYISLEKHAMYFLNYLFLILILSSLCISILWRHRAGMQALLLVPSYSLVLKIFVLGIVVPLAGYLAISAIGIIGGHGYNTLISSGNFFSQIVLMSILIPWLIFGLTKKYVSRKCFFLGVPVPDKNMNKISLAMVYTASGIISCGCFIPVGILCDIKMIYFFWLTYGIFLLIALTVIIGFLFMKLVCSLQNGNKFALYYGALARAWVPSLALAMIFMTTFVKPYLNWREADLVQKDKFIYGPSNAFTGFDQKITLKLKNYILKTLDEIPDESDQ
jgi:hypothetical protein